MVYLCTAIICALWLENHLLYFQKVMLCWTCVTTFSLTYTDCLSFIYMILFFHSSYPSFFVFLESFISDPHCFPTLNIELLDFCLSCSPTVICLVALSVVFFNLLHFSFMSRCSIYVQFFRVLWYLLTIFRVFSFSINIFWCLYCFPSLVLFTLHLNLVCTSKWS